MIDAIGALLIIFGIIAAMQIFHDLFLSKPKTKYIMQKKIYVASSWRNQYQQHVVECLRANGYDVYDFKNPPNKSGFGWEQISPDWQAWTLQEYKKNLEHPLAIAGYQSDFRAMINADICVLVLPCGRSAHTEAGYMRGLSKPTFIIMQDMQEPELMYKLFDGIFSSVEELIAHLNSYR